MSTTATHALFGLASTVTDPVTGLSGLKGVSGNRKTMPLAVVDYDIGITIDASGDSLVINTANGSASGAVGAYSASATLEFIGQPFADETIEVAGILYTFKASAASDSEITIGADPTETALNTAAAVAANDPSVIADTSGTTIATFVAADPGSVGNTYTLAESGSNMTISGALFTGGLDDVGETGAGVNALGVALPAMTKVHGILVLCTSGELLVRLGTQLRGHSRPNGGFQIWDAAGKAEWIGLLTLTAAAPGTVARLVVRAS